MRISGGIAKGRRLTTKRPFSKKLRPTSSKVKEALFDIMRDAIKGASFVDLYAGTGMVGLEALSRGASKAIFVESDRLNARAIKENALRFGFGEKVMVVEGRVEEFLKKAATEGKSFDILFLDPPYCSEEVTKVLPLAGKNLNYEGTVIVEHFFKKKLPETSGELKMLKSYRYGDTVLTLYKRKQED